jgi:hypothetical protein
MARTLHFSLLMIVLGLPATVYGQEVSPHKLSNVVVPSCAAVCNHIMDLALSDVPEEERAAARAAANEVMEECIPQCETDLDEESRVCFFKAKNMADGDACDKALSERLKKRNSEEGKERKPKL